MKEIFCTSLELARRIGCTHVSVKKLIERHKKSKAFKNLNIEKTGKMGRPAKVYILTESQTLFLILLMDNSENVLNEKEKFINEFCENHRKIMNELNHSI